MPDPLPPSPVVAHPATVPPSSGGAWARRARGLWIPLSICAGLSGLMTWLNLGFVPGFAWHWLGSFVSALPVMALGLTLLGVYGNLLGRLMPRAAVVWRTLVQALLMALTLELLMSSVVTLRNIGWGAGFTAAWASAFVRSLPFGLAVSLLMAFVVAPRLRRQPPTLKGT